MLLLGCPLTIEHQLTAPQLERAIRPCPPLPPIPKVANLAINGDRVVADEGGYLLFFSYSRARQAAH